MVVESGIEVISNQVCYSLLDQRAASKMTEVCLKYNVKLLAFGTVAGGFLTEKWIGQPEPKIDSSLTWSQMKYKRFIDAAGGWRVFQNLLLALKKVSDKSNNSIAIIASRYLLEQPAVGGVIIGARIGRSEHIEENKKLLTFSLDQESKKIVKEAIDQMTKIPGDCGDEYRKPPFLTASGDLSHHVDAVPPPYACYSGSDSRVKALSGTSWEEIAGFSRAVRKGNHIFVSGSTATHKSKLIGGNNPEAQMNFVIDKLEGAIQSLGGTLQQVVRTRIYIKNLSDWEAIARVHGQRFKEIQPANTMIKAELIGDEYLVEMEAEAIID
jgi:enamine deaminase RidA (YjgF/YER057c/UK114 family)